MSLLALAQLPLQCYLYCTQDSPGKVGALNKANRDLVRENCGWYMQNMLKSCSLRGTVDIMKKVVDPQSELCGIPGDDAQGRALSLVRAGLSRMTETFVGMAMRFPRGETMGLMLEWERTHLPREVLEAVDVLPLVFVEYAHNEAVVRAGLKLVYYMAGPLTVRESMKYDLLYHIQRSLNVFKDNEEIVVLAMDAARTAVRFHDHLDKYAFTKSLMLIVQNRMREHANSLPVQTAACKLLMFMVESFEGRRDSRHYGIVQELTRAMEAFPTDATLHFFAFWTLDHMFWYSVRVDVGDSYRTRYVHGRAMWEHFQSNPGLLHALQRAETQFKDVVFTRGSTYDTDAEKAKYGAAWVDKYKVRFLTFNLQNHLDTLLDRLERDAF